MTQKAESFSAFCTSWHGICSLTTINKYLKQMEEKEFVKNINSADEQVNEIVENAENNPETDSAVETHEENPEEKDLLTVANEEIEELKKQMLYKQAEFENYRKRTIKEKADLILGGSEKTITAILPVLDDFERAISDNSDDPNAIREGMQLIYNKFVKILEQNGVKKIDTQNADFNVDFHEAIAMVPGVPDEQKGKVIDCVQTGYTLNEKVVRHAKVAVGQ